MRRSRPRTEHPPVRAERTFTSPEVYEFLEDEGFIYAIRLPTNQVLQESISHPLNRDCPDTG